ncbi:MAG: alanine--tRNA ligase [Pseudomonadales bacterium]|nr:alanine--tRNA ligase [Pseudomonadales bacterium]
MNSSELRRAFLDFFAEQGHEVVPSSSLVPGNDPTLLFTNAGMVQFKDVFLGQDVRPYRRAASSQRCVRAGGKHNDLENVGYTARHHTFFEMLGNFSFGDYFKREAIHYAWRFLTERLGLPKARLWVTIFHEDQEAERIWLDEIGIDPQRFSRLGDASNFWSMGETGPCGPCTEIFYDHGSEVAGGPPGSPDEDGDRYIEIWNLVFMQFNRLPDGRLEPLPKPSVDTGMGLERIAAVMQGVHSNYQIDLFRHLLEAAARITGRQDAHTNDSLKVIVDHIRSSSFLIADGVIPGNEGRGYVLRRIIRRALRHGHKLGVKQPFFHRLVAALAQQMGAAYPELPARQAQIERILLAEEEQFSRTLDQGMRILDEAIAQLNGACIGGETLFQLYDTYGFPLDLTADIARERGLQIDSAGFEAAMQAQRERARAASQFALDSTALIRQSDHECLFTGYEQTADDAEVVALYRDHEPVERLSHGETGWVLLDRTPFYAEAGGQVGDRGQLRAGGGRAEVLNTLKQGNNHLHQVRLLQGNLEAGSRLTAEVDPARRQATALNHSATHLLHAALREILGSHVEQKGSLVDAQRLRFDFAHFEAIAPSTLRQIEQRVNDEIRRNSPISVELLPIDLAKARGAMALFGEKYGAEVRVLTMGDGFSVELCGGTHARRTGDIGLFRITAESGISAGVRRIEAVSGAAALELAQYEANLLRELAQQLRAPIDQLPEKLTALLDEQRRLERIVQQLGARLASAASADLLDRLVQVQDVPLLVAAVDGMEAKGLRDLLDKVRDKLGSGVILLASVSAGKVNLIAGVTADLTARIAAGELIKAVTALMGGRGGGRADMAQGGSDQPDALDAALAEAPAIVARLLSA